MMSANVRYAVFGGTLLIRNASDGKKYLYDIVSIKENTGLAFDLNKKASGRQKAVSAYTKTRSQERTAEEAGRTFLQNSDVLYMDEKRAASVLRRMGYYTPIELPRNGYIGTIVHKAGSVKIDGMPFLEVISGSKGEFSLKNAPTVEYLSPEEITPMNGITNSEMYEYLTDDIRRNGYSGRPVVVYETPYGYQALTGSHRVAAAREAGIEIPAVVIYDGDVIDRLEAEHDDTSRAKAAVELFEEGLIDEATRDLLLREDELNSENYGVSQQHARRNNQQHRHRDQTQCRCFHIILTITNYPQVFT